MADLTKLRRAFTNAVHGNQQRNTWRAKLGDNNRRLQSGKPNFVWARVQMADGLTVTEVLCLNVAPSLNAPVLVGYNVDNQLEVLSIDPTTGPSYYGDELTGGNVGPHAWAHGRLAPDAMRVDPLQINGLLVTPTDPPSTAVNLGSWFYQVNATAYEYWAGGTVELAGYIPTAASEQRPVIVGYDRTNKQPHVLAGDSEFLVGYTPYQIPFNGSDVALIEGTAEFEAAAAVRLRYAMGTVENYDIVLDCRRWVGGSVSTGGSSSEATVIAGFSQLRLSNSSSGPTTLVTGAQSTLYLHPYKGGFVSLYNTTSSVWEYHQLTSAISLSLTGLTANHIYDIFVYDSSGLTLEAVSWGGSSSRATALDTQNNVLVQDSAANKLYIGSILIDSGGGTVTHHADNRNFGIWNHYNKVEHKWKIIFTTDSWTVNQTTPRVFNNDATTFSCKFCKGLSADNGEGTVIQAHMLALQSGNASNRAGVSLALNSTSTIASDELINLGQLSIQSYLEVDSSFPPALGLNTVYPLEFTVNTMASVSMFGDAGAPTIFRLGINGSVWQ